VPLVPAFKSSGLGQAILKASVPLPKIPAMEAGQASRAAAVLKPSYDFANLTE